MDSLYQNGSTQKLHRTCSHLSVVGTMSWEREIESQPVYLMSWCGFPLSANICWIQGLIPSFTLTTDPLTSLSPQSLYMHITYLSPKSNAYLHFVSCLSDFQHYPSLSIQVYSLNIYRAFACRKCNIPRLYQRLPIAWVSRPH